MPELRKLFGQSQEVIALQPQHFNGCTAPNAGIAGASAQQGRLTKLRAGTQRIQRKLLPVLVYSHDAGAAGKDNEEGVGCVVLFGNQLTKLVVVPFKQLLQPRLLLLGNEAKKGRARQDFALSASGA